MKDRLGGGRNFIAPLITPATMSDLGSGCPRSRHANLMCPMYFAIDDGFAKKDPKAPRADASTGKWACLGAIMSENVPHANHPDLDDFQEAKTDINWHLRDASWAKCPENLQYL